MVHLRLNERESNPNPHINFITPLPAEDQEDSRQFLRALAAQVRPVMKAHGFVVNSLEEVAIPPSTMILLSHGIRFSTSTTPYLPDETGTMGKLSVRAFRFSLSAS